MAIVTGCHSTGVGIFVCAQGGCQDCLEALIRKHDGLIHAVVRGQGMGGIPYEDLIQEGRIGLWQAIQYFDPERGTPFASYAWLAIQHRVWRARFYADRVEDDKNEEVESWLELVDEIEEDWWRGQVRQALLEVVGKLPVRLEQLIRLAYGLNGPGPYNLATIGRKWGLSRERMRQLRNDALSILRLPALSMQLRSLCERDSRLDYQQALSLNRAWQRSQRRRP